MKKVLFVLLMMSVVGVTYAQTLLYEEDAELLQQWKSEMNAGVRSSSVCSKMYMTMEPWSEDPRYKKDFATEEDAIAYFKTRIQGPGSHEIIQVIDGDALNCAAECYNLIDQRNERSGIVYAWNAAVSNTEYLIHKETGKHFLAFVTKDLCYIPETYYVDKACATSLPGNTPGSDTLFIVLEVEKSTLTGTYVLKESAGSFTAVVGPNPTKSSFKIYLRTPQGVEILNAYNSWEIYDINSNLVKQGEGDAGEIADLNDGIYFLHLISSDEGRLATVKIIKQ